MQRENIKFIVREYDYVDARLHQALCARSETLWSFCIREMCMCARCAVRCIETYRA